MLCVRYWLYICDSSIYCIQDWLRILWSARNCTDHSSSRWLSGTLAPELVQTSTYMYTGTQWHQSWYRLADLGTVYCMCESVVSGTVDGACGSSEELRDVPCRKTIPAQSCSWPRAHGYSPPVCLALSQGEEAWQSEIGIEKHRERDSIHLPHSNPFSLSLPGLLSHFYPPPHGILEFHSFSSQTAIEIAVSLCFWMPSCILKSMSGCTLTYDLCIVVYLHGYVAFMIFMSTVILSMHTVFLCSLMYSIIV